MHMGVYKFIFRQDCEFVHELSLLFPSTYTMHFNVSKPSACSRQYILGVRSHRACKQDRIAINAKDLILIKNVSLYSCLTNGPLLLDNNSLALLSHKLHQIIWSSCSFICCT